MINDYDISPLGNYTQSCWFCFSNTVVCLCVYVETADSSGISSKPHHSTVDFMGRCNVCGGHGHVTLIFLKIRSELM